jgi:hypothetical protein
MLFKLQGPIGFKDLVKREISFVIWFVVEIEFIVVDVVAC